MRPVPAHVESRIVGPEEWRTWRDIRLRAPADAPDGVRQPPGHAAVISMWVDPAHRGRGLSRRVLDVLVGWARARRLTVEIGVSRADPAARAAYESYGFVATDRCRPPREGSDRVCDVLVLAGGD